MNEVKVVDGLMLLVGVRVKVPVLSSIVSAEISALSVVNLKY